MTSPYGGFTLIEMLVYIGLSTILMAGAFVSANALRNAIEMNGYAAQLEQEGSFASEKILRALIGADIEIPSTGSDSDSLISTGPDGAETRFFSSGTSLSMEQDGKGYPLTTAAVTLSGLGFTRDPASAGSPDCLHLSLTLEVPGRARSSRTFTGMSCSPYR